MSIEVLKSLLKIPCINDAGGIVGYDDAMRKTKIRELANRISDARKEGINDPNEIMQKVFKDLFDENKQAADYRKAVQLNHAIKFDSIMKWHAENFPKIKEVVKGVQAKFFGIQEMTYRGRGDSIANKVHSVKADYYGKLTKGLKDEGVLIDFQKKLHHDDLGKELWEFGSSGNERANRMAKVILPIYKEIISEMRANGIPIKDMKNFTASMARDYKRVLNTHESPLDRAKYVSSNGVNYLRDKELAKNRFINFFKEHLDHEETFKGSDPDKWLSAAFDHQTIFDSAKQHALDNDTLAYGGLAARGAKSRVMIHKNAESFLKDIKTYGVGDIFDYVIDTIEKGSKYAGTAKELGTRPGKMLNDVIDTLKARKGIGDNQKIVDKLNFMHRVFDEFTGKASIPESRMWNNITNSIMNYQSMTGLGSSIFPAMNDMNYVAASIMKNFNDNAAQAYGSAFWNYISHMKMGATKDTLDMIGHWAGRDAGYVHSRNGAVDSIAGLQAKAMNLTFKLNGIHWQDEVNYFGSIWNHQYRLAQLRDMPLEQLRDKKAIAFLKRYNFSDKEWDLMRNNVTKFDDGSHLMTPDDVFNYSKEDISKHLGINNAELNDAKVEEVRTDIRRKMIGMLHDEGTYSFLAPDLWEKAALRMGGKANAGTFSSTLVKMITQFKTWQFAELHRVWGSLVDPIKQAEGVAGKILASKGAITYAVGRTLTGYISDTCRRIATGQPIQDPTNWETWAKTGVAGTSMYGEILFDIFQASNGVEATEKFLGPTGDKITKLLDIVNSMYKKATDENYRGHLGTKFFKLGESMTPYMNLYFINLGLRYMFLNELENQIDPEAKRRREHRQRKEGDINTPFTL